MAKHPDIAIRVKGLPPRPRDGYFGMLTGVGCKSDGLLVFEWSIGHPHKLVVPEQLRYDHSNRQVSVENALGRGALFVLGQLAVNVKEGAGSLDLIFCGAELGRLSTLSSEVVNGTKRRFGSVHTGKPIDWTVFEQMEVPDYRTPESWA